MRQGSFTKEVFIVKIREWNLVMVNVEDQPFEYVVIRILDINNPVKNHHKYILHILFA